MTIKEKAKTGETTNKRIPIYTGNDTVKGRLEVRLHKKKKFEHNGIKVELLGIIETPGSTPPTSSFMSNGMDLEPAGNLYDDKTYDFEFKAFQKPYNSYYGESVKLRYVIRSTITLAGYKSSVKSEIDLGVLVESDDDESEIKPINMEVGIDDLLNIKIDIPRNRFGLKEFIEGKILFENVKVLLKCMKLNVVRKEIIGTGEKTKTTQTEILDYEIMDGCPIKGKIRRRGDPCKTVLSRSRGTHTNHA